MGSFFSARPTRAAAPSARSNLALPDELDTLHDLTLSDPSRSLAEGPSPMTSQRQWTELCAARLAELRPDGSPEVLEGVAAQLWGCVGNFHPEIAAEMEHEVWRWDH